MSLFKRRKMTIADLMREVCQGVDTPQFAREFNEYADGKITSLAEILNVNPSDLHTYMETLASEKIAERYERHIAHFQTQKASYEAEIADLKTALQKSSEQYDSLLKLYNSQGLV